MPQIRTFILALIAVLLLPIPVAAANATLTIHFTNNGNALEDPRQGKFYIYEAGKRETYLAWGHDQRPATVPEGTYDVVILYRNDEIRQERVIEELELIGDMERNIAFSIPVAKLTLHVTSGGEPAARGTARYNLYPAGKRGKPLASRRPGKSVTIRPGRYDIEVAYRDARGLQAQWIESYDLEGERSETVEIGSSAARLTVTVTRGERALPPEIAHWRAYRSGVREAPLGERRSGETLVLEVGEYDIGAFYRDGSDRGQRWLLSVPVRGEVHKQIDIGAETASLKVDIRQRGSRLPGAWFSAYAPGGDGPALASGENGVRVQLDAGTYDLLATVRHRGVRAEKWLRGQNVAGRIEVNAEMDLQLASLRVRPSGRRSGRGGGSANLLLVVDSSAGMADRIGARSRLDLFAGVFEEVIGDLEDSSVEVGLRAYGILPASSKNCTDSTLLVPVAARDEAELTRSVGFLRPAGLAPVAHSLEQAAADLPEGDNTLLLVAGAEDGCGGDVCAVAARLLRSGKVTRAFVVGLGVPYEQRGGLDCAGRFYAVESVMELKTSLREILRAATRLDTGTVNVFEPGGPWVAGGALREKIELLAGTYDVQIHHRGKTHLWESVEIKGAMGAEAGPRPPRQR